jgi:hypothetical protein
MDKLKRAEDLGVVKPGWRFIDYAFETGPTQGWLEAIIWGEKGSGKSNLMLQHGYTLFHGFDSYEQIGTDSEGAPISRGVVTNWEDERAWDLVLEHTIYRPVDFANLLSRALKEGKRIPWVGWDDVDIHLPRSMYSTARTIWENFSRNWAAMRANLSIFECTAPRKDRVVSFLLQDMSFDILVSRRKKVEVSRWLWDKHLDEPEAVIKMRVDVDVEELVIENIPKDVWERYWNRKLAIVDEGSEGFKKTLESIDKPETPVPKPRRKSEAICPNCGRDFVYENILQLHLIKCKKSNDSGNLAEAAMVQAPSS